MSKRGEREREREREKRGKEGERKSERELYPTALAAALGRLSKPCLGGFGAQIEIIPHSDTHTR